jgi:hypothetical protein
MAAIGKVGNAKVTELTPCTWANRPSAISFSGFRLWMTDLECWFRSDGARWIPEGTLRLYNNVADIVLLGSVSVSEQKAAGLLLPAGLIGAGYDIDITILDTYSNSGNNKVLRIRLGAANDLNGTAYLTGTTTTTATAQNGCKIRTTTASANAQLGYAASVSTPFGNSSAAVITSAVDMSTASYLVISGQCTNAADTQTIKSYTVDITAP